MNQNHRLLGSIICSYPPENKGMNWSNLPLFFGWIWTWSKKPPSFGGFQPLNFPGAVHKFPPTNFYGGEKSEAFLSQDAAAATEEAKMAPWKFGDSFWKPSLFRFQPLNLGKCALSNHQLSDNWLVATQIFFNVHPYMGKGSQFDEHIFSDGLVQPPTRKHSVPLFLGNWIHCCCLGVKLMELNCKLFSRM